MQQPNLSNFDAWQLLNRDVPAPQSYIDWSFYFLIAACLQRRVWIGQEDNRPLYPNIYPILVGPPATGKGLVIDPVSEILRYWKLTKPGEDHARNGEITEQQMRQRAEAEAMVAQDPELLKMFNKKKKALASQPLLFPMGANATTFESLAETIAASVRRINYTKFDSILNKEVSQCYSHCSLAFVLTELSSLFKKQSENVVNLLTDLYDCKPYEYKTKTQGDDVIHKGCLNFIAGTTFSYMESIFTDRIMNEGFASRAFMIVESQPRFRKWEFSNLDDSQKAAKLQIIQYVKRLSTLYGECSLTPEANEFMRHWWESGENKINNDPKLEYYYGRKNIHTKKLCMIYHFMESKFLSDKPGHANFSIEKETAQAVLKICSLIEKKMHQALAFTQGNPLAKPTKQVLRILQKYPKGLCYSELAVELWDHCNVKEDLKPIIEHLMGTEQVEVLDNPDETRRHKGVIYRMKIDETPLITATQE